MVHGPEALWYINYLIHVCADVILDQGNTLKKQMNQFWFVNCALEFPLYRF
jgi:hypothetical protein